MRAMTHPGPSSGSTQFFVTGMTCQGCANAVARALSRISGVTRVAVDLATGRVSADGTASEAALSAAVEQAGYRVRPATGNPAEESNDGRGGQSHD